MAGNAEPNDCRRPPLADGFVNAGSRDLTGARAPGFTESPTLWALVACPLSAAPLLTS